MSLIDVTSDTRSIDPLDVVEHVAVSNDWSFERSGEDEITILTQGHHTDFQVSFTWMHGIEALHIACAFDIRIPAARRAEVKNLIASINEQMWVGHFDIWTQNGLIMFRHALLLAGGAEASQDQCATLLAIALESCERYYPAFQFVVWAGKSAAEAMHAAMFETEGEA